MGTATLLPQLRQYFASAPGVAFAFMFGSRASGWERHSSDWDIGVYLLSENDELEQQIWREVERIVQTEVDLVILNRAPATLAWRVITQGTELAINDRDAYLDLLLRAGDEANDFYQTAHEYYQIFQRSASLALGDRSRLESLVQFLEQEIKEYPRFRAMSDQEYKQNRDHKRIIEHWIERLVQAIIDCAKIILASEKQRIPDTYKEIVAQLAMVEPFGRDDLCERLSRRVSLRNLLAHEYLDLRWKQISSFVADTEPDWRQFVERVKTFLLTKL